MTRVPAAGPGLAPAGRAAQTRELSLGAACTSHPDGKEKLVRRGLDPVADGCLHHGCSLPSVLPPECAPSRVCSVPGRGWESPPGLGEASRRSRAGRSGSGLLSVAKLLADAWRLGSRVGPALGRGGDSRAVSWAGSPRSTQSSGPPEKAAQGTCLSPGLWPCSPLDGRVQLLTVAPAPHSVLCYGQSAGLPASGGVCSPSLDSRSRAGCVPLFRGPRKHGVAPTLM